MHGGISKIFFLDHFSPSFLSQKLLFQELSPLILNILGGQNRIWLTLIKWVLNELPSSVRLPSMRVGGGKNTPHSLSQSIKFSTWFSMSLIKMKVRIRNAVWTRRNKIPMQNTKILRLQHFKGPKYAMVWFGYMLVRNVESKSIFHYFHLVPMT